MRWKIILVNGGVVLVLTLLTFFLLRTSFEGVVSNPAEQRRELARALRAADAQLSLDALRLERWLSREAARPENESVFGAGTASARSDAATAQANRLKDAAIAEPTFERMAPSLVVFVDPEGVGVGRNGSELMRGDPIGKAYPALVESIRLGQTGSALWINKERQEQLFVAFAPVRDKAGTLLGAIVLGTPLSDERLKRTSEATSARPVALVAGGSAVPVAAGSGSAGFQAAPVGAAVSSARKGSLSYASELVDGQIFAALRLGGYGATDAVLVASIPATRIESVDALLWPIFAVGVLGLFLVVAGGVLLGNYISRPVAEIEEGLLLVMNGQQDLRFDLEHDELGGLTSRINQLLNTLLGVAEEESSTEN